MLFRRYVATLSLILVLPAANAVETDRDLWDNRCANCHGADGKGSTKMGRRLHIVDLTDAPTQAKFTDAEAFNTIKRGRTDPQGKIRMPPAVGLGDVDISRLVAFVRSLVDH